MILVTLQEVMHTSYEWLEIAEILSTASGCLIAALSILIFSASCISVYHNSKSTTPQLVFIILLYPGIYIWGLLMALSIGSTFISSVLNEQCYNDEIFKIWNNWAIEDQNTVCNTILEGEQCENCIDLYPFHFVFPTDARKEDMWICGREIFLFCDDDLPKIVIWWIICLISSLFTLMGITMHLHDLSWFRTTILEENKIRQKQEIKYIRNHVSSVLHSSSRPQSTDLGLMLLNQTK